MDLIEGSRIRCIFDEAVRLVELGLALLDRGLNLRFSENVGPLIHSLKTMNSLFGTCLINLDVDSRESPPMSLYIPYTDTEEAWLQLQFKQLQNQNLSVTVPVEFRDEYLYLLTQ